MDRTIIAEASLRDRNQMTIPDAVVRASDIRPGDRFAVEVSTAAPDLVVLRRLRTSYAGALRGMWGTDPASAVDEEREGWGNP